MMMVLHSGLCRDQSDFWQLTEQYMTTLHLAHRFIFPVDFSLQHPSHRVERSLPFITAASGEDRSSTSPARAVCAQNSPLLALISFSAVDGGCGEETSESTAFFSSMLLRGAVDCLYASEAALQRLSLITLSSKHPFDAAKMRLAKRSNPSSAVSKLDIGVQYVQGGFSSLHFTSEQV